MKEACLTNMLVDWVKKQKETSQPRFFFLLQLHEVGGLVIFNKEELTKFGFKSAKKKPKLPDYENLRHFSGYLYRIFFKNNNISICTIFLK
jgi:hypothetical protein